ncbi:hypothetical protein [Arsukibacterium sp.]|uniref:hypothetical protein n=1 Tax=Arsukibacterium sp. TaxID=1977258 RepID=UPI00299D59C3|nr:hypothetical protein [Arsukibacterium sp.]MDX1538361.1 hypothetical protein [Arsukibacterium sp.]
MLDNIEKWIDETLEKYSRERTSCEVFAEKFTGFYPVEFLNSCYFVVVDEIPKPDFPELHEMGLTDFIEMDVDGITYKNTYFIKKGFETDYRLHFHELVHVLQWQLLGAQSFIQRYIQEINMHGYRNAPLEKMAYGLDSYFAAGQKPANIPAFVQMKI